MKIMRRESISFDVEMNLNKFNVFVISGIVLFSCFLNIQAASTTEELMVPSCDEIDEACGWGVFDPKRRSAGITIFKKNKKCLCEPGFVCAIIGKEIDTSDKTKEIAARCRNSSELISLGFSISEDDTTCKQQG